VADASEYCNLAGALQYLTFTQQPGLDFGETRL